VVCRRYVGNVTLELRREREIDGETERQRDRERDG